MISLNIKRNVTFNVMPYLDKKSELFSFGTECLYKSQIMFYILEGHNALTDVIQVNVRTLEDLVNPICFPANVLPTY